MATRTRTRRTEVKTTARTPKRATQESQDSDRTAYRMKPGEPSPKTSQSGYGHKSNTGGTVAREGTRRRPG